MMMTRKNYEPYFMDYLDGNLKENMIDEFLDFLEQNSDLKEELHLLENIHLPEEQMVFSDKKHLYKSFIDEKTPIDIKAIALMEGDLREDERDSFKVYLSRHPELQKEVDLFGKTRMAVDTGIKYQDKQQLYRKSKTAILLNWTMRAAALVIILWGVQTLFQNKSITNLPISNQEVASIKPQLLTADKQIKSKVKTQEIETGSTIANHTKALHHSNHKSTLLNSDRKHESRSVACEGDLTAPGKINPLMAFLIIEPIENKLAVSHSVNTEPIHDSRQIMTVDEFLANRVKKAGSKGLLSVNRILRIGLSVASEISGNRLGYKVINGKIASLDFESKLMAFSIPLEKK